MNRNLRWALAVTLVLTAAALLTPHDAQVTREAGDRLASDETAARPVAVRASGVPAPLPHDLERQVFLSPERDPFAPPAPPPAPAPPPVPAVPAAAPPPPPPAPPPPFNARYVAQLLTPAGERLLYLRDGEQLIIAQAGVALPGGYVIEALVRADANGAASAPLGRAAGATESSDIVAIEVLHPPTNHRQTLPIPRFHRPQP